MLMAGKLGVRHVQAVLLSGALIVNYMQLGNLGIAVAVISNKDDENDARQMERIFYTPRTDEVTNQVSMITGSFFYSQMVFSIIGGYLSLKVNNKLLILVASVVGVLVSYLTPILVETLHWKAFLFIRLAQGAAQGFVKPVVINMAARWLPTEEMLLLGPGIICGVYTGVSFMLMMGGYLGAGHGGWPSIFYFAGNCGLLWIIAFYGLGFSTPNDCFYISDLEKNYINNNIPPSVLLPYRRNIPWKKIFTNVPLYVLLVCQIANNWAYHVFVKILPIYLQQILHYNLHQTGLMCGVPFLSGCVAIYIIIFFFKCLWHRGKLDHVVVRHVCNAIAQFGSAYCFMFCSTSENLTLTMFFHQLGLVISLFQLFGYYMNFYDLSPTYVGLTTGLCSGVGTIGSILGPHFTLQMYDEYGDDEEAWTADRQFKAWRKGYDLISLNYFIAGTAFMFLGEVKEQEFDKNELKKPAKHNMP